MSHSLFLQSILSNARVGELTDGHCARMRTSLVGYEGPSGFRVGGGAGEGMARSAHKATTDAHPCARRRRFQPVALRPHNHRIAIYEPNGAAGVFVDCIRGSLRTSEGVDVASDGTNYVTSASRHNLLKIRDGTIVSDVGEGGGDANQYSRPHEIEAASDGRVVVADPGYNRLQVLGANLGFVKAVGDPQLWFDEPKYFTIDVHDWIY